MRQLCNCGREDCRGPQVSRGCPEGIASRAEELDAIGGAGVWLLDVEVGAGGCTGGPAAPMGKLLRRTAELYEASGATPTQRVPGIRGLKKAPEGGVEGDGTGRGPGGILVSESREPLVDEGGRWSPNTGSVALGSVYFQAARAEGRGAEAGGFTDPEQEDKGDENEAKKAHLFTGSGHRVLVDAEVEEGEPCAVRARGKAGEC